ncbi:MAG: bifunctional nicotinamidase/pyrazinamidase [Desulfatiglandaceae bacterium]
MTKATIVGLTLACGCLAFFGVTFIAGCPECAASEKIGVIVVDVQGDFTTWKKGSLAVKGTDEAFVAGVQKATETAAAQGWILFGTQDWHPADHVSFFTNHEGKKPYDLIKLDGRTQVLWPPHCIQGTENAQVLVDNNLFLAIVKKGQDSRFDSYSGFQDDGGARTEMEAILKRNGIQKVVVYGIATDYCVKATAIDAARAGFKVIVVKDLCRGVAPDTSASAIEEMQADGIKILDTLDIDKIRDL